MAVRGLQEPRDSAHNDLRIVQSVSQTLPMLKEATPSAIQAWLRIVRNNLANGIRSNLKGFIDNSMRALTDRHFAKKYAAENRAYQPDSWWQFPIGVLEAEMPALFATAETIDPWERVQRDCEALRLEINPHDQNREFQYYQSIRASLAVCGFLLSEDRDDDDTMNLSDVRVIDPERRKALQVIMISNLRKGTCPQQPHLVVLLHSLIAESYKGKGTFAQFWAHVESALTQCHTYWIHTRRIERALRGSIVTSKGSLGDISKEKSSRDESSKLTNKKPRLDARDKTVCEGCGRSHQGNRLTCHAGPSGRYPHPDFNTQGRWSDSAVGKAYSALSESCILNDKKLSPDKSHLVMHRPARPFKKPKAIVSVMSANPTATPSIQMCFWRDGEDSMLFPVLLDSGAGQANYIRQDVVDQLTAGGLIVGRFPEENRACSCFLECKSFSEVILARCKVLAADKEFKLNVVRFVVADTLSHPVIVGLPTLLAFNLLAAIPTSVKDSSSYEDSVTQHTDTVSVSTLSCLIQESVDRLVGFGEGSGQGNSSDQWVSSVSGRDPDLIRHCSSFLTPEEDAQGFDTADDNIMDVTLRQGINFDPAAVVNEHLVHIEGEASLQLALRELVNEYADCFRSTVSREPAKVPPMPIEVDEAKWQSLRVNKFHARQQSPDRNREISRQVEILLDLNVIRPSNASCYSQVHMTPKTDGSWRFCVDYRALNECSTSLGGQIPVIEDMLRDIGVKRPCYFAVMDLTSGFHQAPIEERCMKYTAFITYQGVYEWTRVGMGLKGSPSYFQRIMAQHVLKGLLHQGFEIYQDDCLIYANSPDELVANLRVLLSRFREIGITANPKKCKLGLSQIEFVGRVISETGIAHVPSRLSQVLETPLPSTVTELRSFLGLANYFRDHVKNFTFYDHDLRAMIGQKPKKAILHWTDRLVEQFNEFKRVINLCPKLYFVNSTLPVVLCTDASDYGIGAYLHQLDGDEELPIAFMSRALSAVEQRWSTIEKEAFAIVAALRKFRYVIRDVRFLLRTDHKNLVYLNEPLSSKVMRWKLEVQEFDFNVEHIAGHANVVADAFSRFVPREGSQTHEIAGLYSWLDSVQLHTAPEFQGPNRSSFDIPADKEALIKEYHNSSVGHFGTNYTVKVLQDNGHTWDSMHAHVTKFIRQCLCCQKMRVLKQVASTTPYTSHGTAPGERLCMDTLNIKSHKTEGDKYVLVIIDCFTRWVELFPLETLSASEAASKLLQHFGRFGQPFQIQTDNGSQFANAILKELTTHLGVQHVKITPYSHEENGMVERANKEVLRHLRAYCFDNSINESWPAALPYVQRILNMKRSEITGAAPAEMLLGVQARLQRGIFPPTSLKSSRVSISGWMKQQLDIQDAVIRRAQILQAQNEHQFRGLSRSLNQCVFKLDEYVLVDFETQDKLALHRRGPMKIVHGANDTFKVLDLITEQIYSVHVSRLHKFDYDPRYVDPEELALKEKKEFIIEEILDHSAENPKDKYSFYFLIRWKGYSEDYDSWEPYSGLKHTVQLEAYIKKHRIPGFIKRKTVST